MKSFVSDTAVESAHALILHLLRQMYQEPERVFYVAFGGGSCNSLLFDVWANEYLEQTPWYRLRIFWVDEWCVPIEDSASNYGTMQRLLLHYIPGFQEWSYPIDGLQNPLEEAHRYSELLYQIVPRNESGIPALDSVFLEAEPDGHLSSIHAGQEELLKSLQPYVVDFHPKEGQQKIVMTGCLLFAAKELFFFLVGKQWKVLVNDILNSGDTGIAAYVAHHARSVCVFSDALAEGSYEKNKSLHRSLTQEGLTQKLN